MPSMPSIDGLKPYRIEIQQGNFLSQEMVSKLKIGMTREQVRFVLGTPLVTDIFHADRWDYVFYREPRGGAKERASLTVFFEQERLARIVSDVPEKPAAEAPKAQGPGPDVPKAATPQPDAPKAEAAGKAEAKN